MSSERPPSELRTRVEKDLRPVRPLPPPWRRALYLVPLALFLPALVHLTFGVRSNAGELGVPFLWAPSAAQWAAGLALLALALRESVPGEESSRRALHLGLGLVGLWLAAVAWGTWLRSPTLVPAELGLHYWRVCASWSAALGLPMLALGLLLAMRAFPLRPAVAGAICGLGAGLLSEAGWRTFCEVSLPLHILQAHAFGVLALTLLGALIGTALGRRRS